MVKRCVATDCSNMYKDGVSLFQFPRDLALRKQWTKRCKGLVPIGKGQVITPFCAVSISQTTPLKKTQLLQQDLGLKNEGVSSHMLYQLGLGNIAILSPIRNIGVCNINIANIFTCP